MNPSWLLSRFDYPRMAEMLKEVPVEQSRETIRTLCKNDLFFLLVYVLNRRDADNDWCFARCREVELEPDGHLDLWFRAGYKSSIISFALTIQEIIKDPEITIGLFSHTRPIAKGFLRQIKREFELNTQLFYLFPEIFYQYPQKQSAKWSEDEGILVKRSGNPKESTLEAWGLVDGMPTSRHYQLLIYDDVVTRESVTTPEMIEKTTDALALSFNLGTQGGRRRFIGTRYHFNDTYRTILERGTAIARIYPATVDGSIGGESVFLSQEDLEEKRRDMGPYVYACQMLQSPVADSLQGFQRDWLRFYDGQAPRNCNWYLLVDAANGKRKSNDYTAIWAVGLGEDGNMYCIPEVRDRLNLTERTARLMTLHRKYQPIQTRYEIYGMQGDITYIRKVQDDEKYNFPIIEVSGPTSKEDRIKRLVPLFENSKIWLPRQWVVTDYEGIARDLIHSFIEEEYIGFPVPLHDDMCLVAGTKIATNKGDVPIENIKIGDLILTPDGYKAAVACGSSGNAKVICRNGIKGTVNHPVFTIDKGYIRLDTLTCFHETIGVNLCGWIKITLLKSLSSTVLTTGEWVEVVNIIYHKRQLMLEGRILKAYMLQFGNFIINGQFQKVMRLIISTLIHLTWSLGIWSVYRQGITVTSLKQWIWKKSGEIWNVLDHLRQFGTAPLKVLNGIENMRLKSLKKYLSLGNAYVLNVISYLFPRNQRDLMLSTVAIYAAKEPELKLHHERKNIRLFASYVGQKLQDKKQELDSVPEVVSIEEESVYNLTVEDAHCYFANGILVHNCDALARIQEDEGRNYGVDKKIKLTLQWPMPRDYPDEGRESRDWRL